MFNLVGKRYLFLIISLVVIIPGVISLVFKGLNVGIDFLGGANIELRPDKTITTPAVKNSLKSLNLLDLQVITGSNESVAGNQTIWVRLNTQIDKNVPTIRQSLQQIHVNLVFVRYRHRHGDEQRIFSPAQLGQSQQTVIRRRRLRFSLLFLPTAGTSPSWLQLVVPNGFGYDHWTIRKRSRSPEPTVPHFRSGLPTAARLHSAQRASLNELISAVDHRKH